MRTDTQNIGMPGKLPFRIGVLETSTSEVIGIAWGSQTEFRGAMDSQRVHSLSRSGETNMLSVAGGARATDDMAMVYRAHHKLHIYCISFQHAVSVDLFEPLYIHPSGLRMRQPTTCRHVLFNGMVEVPSKELENATRSLCCYQN